MIFRDCCANNIRIIIQRQQMQHQHLILKYQTENDTKYLQTNNLIWKQYQQKTTPNQTLHPSAFTPQITHYNLLLSQRQITLVILHYKIVPSTTLLSEQWPRDFLQNNKVFCFLADEQTKGVGQHSNKWISPSGNIYLSLLLQTSIATMKAISFLTSNAVIMAIDQYSSVRPKCKWINDVIFQNKKVAGILIKNQIYAGVQQPKTYTQIGVGINIKQPPSQQFTCLQCFSTKQVDISQFLLAFLKILLTKIYSKDSLLTDLKMYQQSLIYLNQNVVIYDESLTKVLLQGIFYGINDCGHALIQTTEGMKVAADGRMRRVQTQGPSRTIDIKSIMQEL